jgi:cellulose synthase/poly-beta-1,6-N-acetylglucosamine synthase-like glycosyltransferase
LAILGAWLAPLATLGLWLLFVSQTVQRRPWAELTPSSRAWLVTAVVAVTVLCHASAMYLVGRAGALVRIRHHRRASRAALDERFRRDGTRMVTLVPSYAEEPAVVAATLWSAALQEFPDLRVVLLIDDPPEPTDPAARARLAATRDLPMVIGDALAEPRMICARAHDDALHAPNLEPTRGDVDRLLATCERAASWLRETAAGYPVSGHADRFLVEEVFLGLARMITREARDLAESVRHGRLPTRRRLLDIHLRLLRIFSADLDSFERKRYVSLSHEANKAMNLNSYLGLMGASWRIEQTAAGAVLRRCDERAGADIVVPDADFVLTLDADSIVRPEYCVRLVHELSRRKNQDVAVIQTPYCAIPGALTMVERVAGATTDLQHLHHLGKTHFGATFWVGANAIIRRSALDDIATMTVERGFLIWCFIQDRTVIEDTESSMDLAARGWRLLNYPERLSYSATPPDFGSLVVQRRRWANGGLIILPKTRHLVGVALRRRQRVRLMEIGLRVDYLTSIAVTCLAAPVLMVVPTTRLLGPTVFLTALPFLLAQAADLRRLGHRARDLLWVTALNLVLIPVNLSGVLKSIEQAVTGRKIPFARTPKIENRVAAPSAFVVAPYLAALFILVVAWETLQAGHWVGLGFAAVTAALLLSGAVTFIGVRDGLTDIGHSAWRERGRRPGPRALTGSREWPHPATLVGSNDRVPPDLDLEKAPS